MEENTSRFAAHPAEPQMFISCRSQEDYGYYSARDKWAHSWVSGLCPLLRHLSVRLCAYGHHGLGEGFTDECTASQSRRRMPHHQARRITMLAEKQRTLVAGSEAHLELPCTGCLTNHLPLFRSFSLGLFGLICERMNGCSTGLTSKLKADRRISWLIDDSRQ